MDDNTIEIRDDEINVQEIMAKIRQNIQRRQAAGELPLDPDSLVSQSPQIIEFHHNADSFRDNLSYVNSCWDIRNNSYFISSHRQFLGKYLIKGRQLVHGEVQRYVDPMIIRQTMFNQSIARLLAQTSQKCAEIDQRSLHQEETLSQILVEKVGIKERIRQNVDERFHNALSVFDREIRDRLGLVHILEERMRKAPVQEKPTGSEELSNYPLYILFEDKFRGSRDEIKWRQKEFLQYFENCSNVLDIGCGRGEFLEILRENSIGAKGVDLDRLMVEYCHSLQLKVEHSDAIVYLEKTDDCSFDGIFMDQVIEHLEPAYLARLLLLCYQKLKNGHYLVIETVNPLSFISFVNFYIDFSHKRPVHPETLEFLMKVAGFQTCNKKFFSPIPDENRLRKVMISEGEGISKKNAEIFNQNIELLNNVLFGPQDYAIIGEK